MKLLSQSETYLRALSSPSDRVCAKFPIASAPLTANPSYTRELCIQSCPKQSCPNLDTLPWIRSDWRCWIMECSVGTACTFPTYKVCQPDSVSLNYEELKLTCFRTRIIILNKDDLVFSLIRPIIPFVVLIKLDLVMLALVSFIYQVTFNQILVRQSRRVT
jgi:hypothetical protein